MQAIKRIAEFSVGKMDWRRLSRRKATLVMFVLSVSFLLAQGIELSHSHENLQSKLDCHICLKHSSKGKLLPGSSIDFSLAAASVPRAVFAPEQPSLSVPPAKSRDPPQLFNA